LKSLAIQSKITLPADVSKSDAETFGKLSKLSGAQFDKAYANEMVKDREKDVAEFQKEATSGNDPRCSFKRLACRFVPRDERRGRHLPDCIRLSLQVKAQVTGPAAVGFPPKQAEEHFLHGPTMRPEKITLPAAGAFASLADHGEIITPYCGLKGIRFFPYSVVHLFS
jgi:hypothetical protein